MIIDRATIHLKAGSGGNGSSVFYTKDSFKKIGWGGDGGRGGSIYCAISPHLYDVSKFRGTKVFAASHGGNGASNNKTGNDADDLTLEVPQGTLIKTSEGVLIADMMNEEAVLLVRGGKGGRGNYRHPAATEGEPGQEMTIALDYRIPNDVALLGFPNVGKTSLFNALVGKTYKVAHYPFTTTTCIWGAFDHDNQKIIVLDMPALVEGSGEGKGVGSTFLKHLYRTKILLILSDNKEELSRQQESIFREIEHFDRTILQNKKFFYLLTKADKIETKNEDKILPVSVETGFNLDVLKELLVKNLSTVER